MVEGAGSVNRKRARTAVQSPGSQGGSAGSTAEAAITVMFDSEEEYVRFTDYVFQQHGGHGIELTNVPIVASLRVKPWLLEQTRGRFALHPVTREEIEAAQDTIRRSGRKPFDPANLTDFRVPGIAPAKRLS